VSGDVEPVWRGGYWVDIIIHGILKPQMKVAEEVERGAAPRGLDGQLLIEEASIETWLRGTIEAVRDYNARQPREPRDVPKFYTPEQARRWLLGG
jgi:hypothetical protein